MKTLEESYYLDPNGDTSRANDEIKMRLNAIKQDLLAERLTPKEAREAVKAYTALLNVEYAKAIESVFSKFIVPSQLFEQILKEVNARKNTYSLAEGIGCIRATFHDCGSVMSQQQKETFVAAVGKNIRKDELERGEL